MNKDEWLCNENDLYDLDTENMSQTEIRSIDRQVNNFDRLNEYLGIVSLKGDLQYAYKFLSKMEQLRVHLYYKQFGFLN